MYDVAERDVHFCVHSIHLQYATDAWLLLVGKVLLTHPGPTSHLIHLTD
jgi:hypothetical protein